MLLYRAITILSIFGAIVAAELVPVARYIGEHKAACHPQKITGTLVGDKIYTFGGCYFLPYSFLIDQDGNIGYQDSLNVTDSSTVYDITTKKWSFETNTPRPLLGSSVTVVDKDIYFHNIQAKPRVSQPILWKYSTDTKKWTELPQLPFITHGNLLICHNAGKMYFMGSVSSQRNIIHVHNMATNSWEDAIFLDKRVSAKRIICHDSHISAIGTAETEKYGTRFRFGFNLVDDEYTLNKLDLYYNGTVQMAKNFTVGLGIFFPQTTQLNEWFYTSVISRTRNETSITKINSLTLETVKLYALPYALENLLIVPTENDEIYLFGVEKDETFVHTENDEIYLFGVEKDETFVHIERQLVIDPAIPKIKTFNHKLVMPKKSIEHVAESNEGTKEQ